MHQSGSVIVGSIVGAIINDRRLLRGYTTRSMTQTSLVAVLVDLCAATQSNIVTRTSPSVIGIVDWIIHVHSGLVTEGLDSSVLTSAGI